MKNKTIAGILALVLWSFWAHKFYLERKTAGVFYVLLFRTPIPWIVGLVEGIMLLSMPQTDFDAKYNNGQPSQSAVLFSNNLQLDKKVHIMKELSTPSSLQKLDQLLKDWEITMDQYLSAKEKYMHQHYE